MKRFENWLRKMQAYHLTNKLSITIVLGVITIISMALYPQPWVRDNEIVSEMLLAIFTSLLVSVLVMATEIYVSYKDYEREKFLMDIFDFGIENLNKDKEETLRESLKSCKKMVWISGYRLIMTNRLKQDFADAVERGAKGVAVLCAPWTQAYKLVYGESEDVMDNYFEFFHAISDVKRKNQREFNAYITEKPIFSDTYRVDGKLITGPYMHNKDGEYRRIMARDFFSYNIARESLLYELVENEFLTLIDESPYILNWDRFDDAYKELSSRKRDESEKRALFYNACDKVCSCSAG